MMFAHFSPRINEGSSLHIPAPRLHHDIIDTANSLAVRLTDGLTSELRGLFVADAHILAWS